MQESIKAHIAIASTFTSPDVEYLDKAPTNKIKGKNIGHTKSEIDATIFSNCSKNEKIKQYGPYMSTLFIIISNIAYRNMDRKYKNYEI